MRASPTRATLTVISVNTPPPPQSAPSLSHQDVHRRHLMSWSLALLSLSHPAQATRPSLLSSPCPATATNHQRRPPADPPSSLVRQDKLMLQAQWPLWSEVPPLPCCSRLGCMEGEEEGGCNNHNADIPHIEVLVVVAVRQAVNPILRLPCSFRCQVLVSVSRISNL